MACAQTVLTLAVAEECLEFEHRDLHWGNLLLKPLRSSAAPLHFALRGAEMRVAHAGVQLCLIDFTMARLRKADGAVMCPALDELPPNDEDAPERGPWLFDGAQGHPQVRPRCRSSLRF